MPDLLDLGERHFRPFGERGLGEPRRDADAERSGEELEQRPALGGIEPVEPMGQEARHLRRHGALQLLHDVVKPRRLYRRLGAWPDQRDGLGGVADIVAREAEQHRIDARLDHLAEDAAERQPEEQPVGERGERPAAVRDLASRQNNRRADEACRCATAYRRAGPGVPRSASRLPHPRGRSAPAPGPTRPVD